MAATLSLSPLSCRSGSPTVRHDHHLYHHCPGCHWDHIQVLVSGAWNSWMLFHDGALGLWTWVLKNVLNPWMQGALTILLLFSPKLGS